MAVNSEADYQNTLVKTKKLNDTAVEYINGIEVIKVFGKEKFSYDKFVTAAREGADCFIEWMRKFNLEMGTCDCFSAIRLALSAAGWLLFLSARQFECPAISF